MAGSALVSRPGPEGLPYAYTLGATDQIRPDTIFATVDGAGASGPFQVAVSYLAPDGTRVMRAVLSTVLAAGASADVSWFPGGGVDAVSGGLPEGLAYTWQPSIGTIAAGSIVGLTFGDPAHGGAPASGTQVFDFLGGDYFTALAKATGEYTISVNYRRGIADVAEPGAYASNEIYMAQLSDSPEYFGNVPLDMPVPSFVGACMTATYRVEAGDICFASIRNLGANPHSFTCELNVGFVETT